MFKRLSHAGKHGLFVVGIIIDKDIISGRNLLQYKYNAHKK